MLKKTIIILLLLLLGLSSAAISKEIPDDEEIQTITGTISPDVQVDFKFFVIQLKEHPDMRFYLTKKAAYSIGGVPVGARVKLTFEKEDFNSFHGSLYGKDQKKTRKKDRDMINVIQSIIVLK